MTDPMNQARSEREVLRWVILLTLFHAEPYGCSEAVILRTAQDLSFASSDLVRRELKYLKGMNFIEVKDKQAIWFAQLTHKGCDFVDYRSDDVRGIARPDQWV